MRIHLVTVVGSHVEVLPFMLRHYREQGVSSFLINVQLSHAADPTLDIVRRIATECDCPIASVTVGDWQSLQQGLWAASMQTHPEDWCVLADQDELHLFPDNLTSMLAYCDRHGYEYVNGAFVDRVNRKATFTAVDQSRPLWPQFPLGGFLSYPLMGSDPRKVVAAKGHVPVSIGHHIAVGGIACPSKELFVQVHHFKWTAGLADRLTERSRRLRENNISHWVESARFVKYWQRHHGRLDLGDPRFLIAACEPGHPHWQLITAIVEAITERTNIL